MHVVKDKQGWSDRNVQSDMFIVQQLFVLSVNSDGSDKAALFYLKAILHQSSEYGQHDLSNSLLDFLSFQGCSVIHGFIGSSIE